MKTQKHYTFGFFLVPLLIFYFCYQGQNQEVDEKGSIEESPAIEIGQPNQLPEKIISSKDGAEMVLIPEGEFIFGMNKSERDRWLKRLATPNLPLFMKEFPKQTESLPAYYIDVFEVTNEQYKKFIRETGNRKPRFLRDSRWNHPKQPVVGVGWEDAEAYAHWAGKRLPSEKEWEKAARGTDGRIWPWGDEPNADNYNGKGQGNWTTVVVGSFPTGRSQYGVMDMAGNVWEMTTGIWEDSGHAMRGGSYLNAGAYTRTTIRWAADNEDTGSTWLGFRCVMEISQIKEWAKLPKERR